MNHPFVTLAHLVDYAHCNNVKASVQMMEVCRRNDYSNTGSNSHHQSAQQAPPLVANFVPSSNGNVTFTINNQLTNQVQRLVRERASGYDNLYQLYNGGRSMGRSGYSGAARADPFQHQLVSSILCPPYQGMGSPAKHVTVVAQQPPPQLQIQPPIISAQQVAAAAAAQQQYVPVSMVPANRQMAIVPSWQQLPPQHAAAIQQPLLSDAGDWGRPLIVDSSAILQEQRPVFGPVDVAAAAAAADIQYHTGNHGGLTMTTDHGGWPSSSSSSSSKRNSKHHSSSAIQQHSHHSSSHHHLMVPNHHRSQHDKKEQTQLSPVKKRVKESTPPSEQIGSSYQNCNSRRGHSPGSSQWQHSSSMNGKSHSQVEHGGQHNGRQHTITIHDTPSPAVSVITISDSEDEGSGKGNKVNGGNSRSISNRQRKNVISCVTVGDSDGEEHRSPAKPPVQMYQQQVIKHEPQSTSSGYTSQSQKKRLLAKAQSECMLNIPTKQEPGTDYHHHRSNNEYLQHLHSGSHCGSACKDSVNGYQYVNAVSQHEGNHSSGAVYTNGGEKRVSWAPPVAHAPSSGQSGTSSHRRHSAVPLVNLRDYNNIQSQPHKEYVQPPAAHTTRDPPLGREQHMLAPGPGKGWTGSSHQPLHQGYR